VLAVLLLAGGCDRLFLLDRIPEARDAMRDGEIHDVGTVGDTGSPDAPPGLCPSGFQPTPATNTFYMLSSNPNHWLGAKTACRDMTVPTSPWHVHLAVVMDQAEHDSLYNTFDISSTQPWVGAFDDNIGDDESKFRWITNEPALLQPHWGGGQPDSPDTQNCARMYLITGMADENCGLHYRYLCECDPYPDAI
jgi:hypothetical protein